MKVLGIISGKSEPASRFRIAQYAPYFTALQSTLKLYVPHPLKDADPPQWAKMMSSVTTINKWRIWNTAKLFSRTPLLMEQYKHDIIWQNRLLINTYFHIENYYKKPLAFDIDDAIWLLEGKKPVEKAFAKAAVVLAGNAYLADYAKTINPNTHIIPTAVDTTQLFKLPECEQPFNIGWIGTYHNFRYLEMIKAPLLEFLQKNNDASLTIVSSHPPGFLNFDGNRIIFKQWSRESENELINSFSVGIMPLADEEWVKGKCSCKMLQYLACGVPAVVSPYGQNGIILQEKNTGLPAITNAEWVNALQQLKDDKAMRGELGANGIQLVNEKYSCEVNAKKLNDIFKTIQ